MDVNEELVFLLKCKKIVGVGAGPVRGCQDGCERIIKIFVKMQKKSGDAGNPGSGAGFVGFSVDVNEEVMLL